MRRLFDIEFKNNKMKKICLKQLLCVYRSTNNIGVLEHCNIPIQDETFLWK